MEANIATLDRTIVLGDENLRYVCQTFSRPLLSFPLKLPGSGLCLIDSFSFWTLRTFGPLLVTPLLRPYLQELIAASDVLLEEEMSTYLELKLVPFVSSPVTTLLESQLTRI